MSLTAADWQALWVTLQLATITTVILLLVGLPFAWWLARTAWRGKFIIEALVALPLILPPTVLGFYLLIVLSPQSWLSQWLGMIGIEPLAFSFAGLVIGSVVYSLPFVVQPLHGAFVAIGERPLEVAATLRASPWDRFWSVALPLARPGLLTATVLGFAHTLGEFGVVLMIGGNIPGKTQVVSIAIYEHVETLEMVRAHTLAGVLLVSSMLLLMLVYALNRCYRVAML